MSDKPSEIPIDSPLKDATPVKSEASLARGCGYGCMYTGCSWIALAVIAVFTIPLVAPLLGMDARKLGALFSQLSFWLIALPFGIYGLIINWRTDYKKRLVERDSEKSQDVGG